MTKLVSLVRDFLERRQKSLESEVAERILAKAATENPSAATAAGRGGATGIQALLAQVAIPESGGGSFLQSETARVDPSGNDSTGVVGDLSKPFFTVQGAINAIEGGSFANPLIDCGNNYNNSEDVTTSIPNIGFRATNDGIPIFNHLTHIGTGSAYISFVSCSIGGPILSSTLARLKIFCLGAALHDVSLPSGILEITVGSGSGEINGTLVAGSALYLSGFSNSADNGIVINSPGSTVWVYGSVVTDVTAAAVLNLIDSRLSGTNSASSTIQSDVLLNPTEFDASTLPTSDPHVIGRLWNSSGVVHVSAGP